MAKESADNFIGGELWAKNLPISVYSGPDTTKFVYAIPKNSFVGKIYSYVVRDGKVWWQIDSKNLNRFVKHEEGVFDAQKLDASLEKIRTEKEAEIKEKTDERLADKKGFFEILLDVFNNIGDYVKNLATPLLIIVAIILLMYFNK